jgi:hypothetical protein
MPHTLTHNLLTERVISAFPLSIGTSLAFESIFEGRLAPFDPTRLPPTKVDIGRYSQMWINLSTLFRNIAGAVSKETFLIATPPMLQEALEFEVGIIESLLANEGRDRCKPVFYYADYGMFESLRKPAPFQLRRDTTDLQKLTTLKLKQTMEHFFKQTAHTNCMWVTGPVRPERIVMGLMLTHVPYDLLSYPYFRQLDLIESHTGKLKGRSDWYTKYYPVNGTLLNTLPFLELLLYIFGDQVMFHPLDLRIRKDILQISVQAHWTAFTTEAKVKYDIEAAGHPPLIELIGAL